MTSTLFNHTLSIRINDLNYGQHLGYAQLIHLLHQTRIMFLNHYSLTESNIQETQLLIKQLQVDYQHEAFLHNQLKITLEISQTKKSSINLHYTVYNLTLKNYTAQACEICLFKSLRTKKIARSPDFWQQFFDAHPGHINFYLLTFSSYYQ